MGRGKYPEQSKQAILDVAKELFIEKGFDETSLQDIVNGLHGMTKGVIYHHFESKYVILQAIIETENRHLTPISWSGDTGLEKLQNALKKALDSLNSEKIHYSRAILLKSPRLLGEQYLQMFQEAVPEIEQVIQEGKCDGSIPIQQTKELVELFVLLFNIWFGFQSATYTNEELKQKLFFIKQIFDGLKLPLLSIDQIEQL